MGYLAFVQKKRKKWRENQIHNPFLDQKNVTTFLQTFQETSYNLANRFGSIWLADGMWIATYSATQFCLGRSEATP